MVSIKSLNVLVSPILACFSLQKRTVQVLIRQCFLSLVQNEIGGSGLTCSYRIPGDGIEYDLVLGPKARSIPALGNAQGTGKPIKSRLMPDYEVVHKTCWQIADYGVAFACQTNPPREQGPHE